MLRSVYVMTTTLNDKWWIVPQRTDCNICSNMMYWNKYSQTVCLSTNYLSTYRLSTSLSSLWAYWDFPAQASVSSVNLYCWSLHVRNVSGMLSTDGNTCIWSRDGFITKDTSTDVTERGENLHIFLHHNRSEYEGTQLRWWIFTKIVKLNGKNAFSRVHEVGLQLQNLQNICTCF